MSCALPAAPQRIFCFGASRCFFPCRVRRDRPIWTRSSPPRITSRSLRPSLCRHGAQSICPDAPNVETLGRVHLDEIGSKWSSAWPRWPDAVRSESGSVWAGPSFPLRSRVENTVAAGCFCVAEGMVCEVQDRGGLALDGRHEGQPHPVDPDFGEGNRSPSQDFARNPYLSHQCYPVRTNRKNDGKSRLWAIKMPSERPGISSRGPPPFLGGRSPCRLRNSKNEKTLPTPIRERPQPTRPANISREIRGTGPSNQSRNVTGLAIRFRST